MLTPEVVHYGLAKDVVESRKKVLEVAFEAHPERFVRGIPLPPLFRRRRGSIHQQRYWETERSYSNF